MLYLSNGRYQWAGEPDTNAILPPMCDASSAYTVAETTDWNAIGWEKINNPTKAQIKEGDIFTISPVKSGIWSGHTGIVYSNNSNGITTLEQNYNGKRYVQKILTGNSYYTFGGFMCVVRPKEKITKETHGNMEFLLCSAKTVADAGKQVGKWYYVKDWKPTYIKTPRALEEAKKFCPNKAFMLEAQVKEEWGIK